jgi:putative transposase
MKLVEKHIINKKDARFMALDDICFRAKNLYNAALYTVRQHYFETNEYLGFNSVWSKFKNEQQSDYLALPRKVSNLVLKQVDQNFKSFFGSLRAKKASNDLRAVSIPHYLHKEKGRLCTQYDFQALSICDLRQGYIKLSGVDVRVKMHNHITLEKIGRNYYSNVKQVRIVPGGNHYTLEIIYEIQDVDLLPDNNRYCSIDIGLNNLASVASNVLQSFIINGRPLKHINQFYNKVLAERRSVLEKRNEKKTSKRIQRLTFRRNQCVNDYMHKSSRYLINQLVSNKINTLIIGKNNGWKQEINIGKRNNQNFVQIPHARFIEMLQYKARIKGINVIIQEESYTSKCSFFDNEPICKHDVYVGRRIHRGLFRASDGTLVNADINGALNILKKAVPNVKFANGIKRCAAHPIFINIPFEDGVSINITDIKTATYT